MAFVHRCAGDIQIHLRLYTTWVLTQKNIPISRQSNKMQSHDYRSLPIIGFPFTFCHCQCKCSPTSLTLTPYNDEWCSMIVHVHDQNFYNFLQWTIMTVNAQIHANVLYLIGIWLRDFFVWGSSIQTQRAGVFVYLQTTENKRESPVARKSSRQNWFSTNLARQNWRDDFNASILSRRTIPRQFFTRLKWGAP